MYLFKNTELKDRKDRWIKGIADWTVEDEGRAKFMDRPFFRHALLHFLYTLPAHLVQHAPNGQTLPKLTIRDHQCIDKTCAYLEAFGDDEPEEFTIDGTDRTDIVKWFDECGVTIFGKDCIYVDACLSASKLLNRAEQAEYEAQERKRLAARDAADQEAIDAHEDSYAERDTKPDNDRDLKPAKDDEPYPNSSTPFVINPEEGGQ